MGLRPVPTRANGYRVSEAVLQPGDHIGLKHEVHSTKGLVYKRPAPVGEIQSSIRVARGSWGLR